MKKLIAIILFLPIMLMAQTSNKVVSEKESVELSLTSNDVSEKESVELSLTTKDVLNWEIKQFVGEGGNYILERAKLISEIDSDKRSISVRTETNSLTFNIKKSVIYSSEVEVPIVAYCDNRTILILPKI